MTQAAADLHWMQKACALAENGRWNTAPNPRVGCVIVHGEVAIAEGWHAQIGGDHAEVHALSQLDPHDVRLASSTAYVTLEPCNHHGRTPPCSAVLIERRIRRIVVGMQGPRTPVFRAVALHACAHLGQKLPSWMAHSELRWQNRRFLSSLERGRPWIVLKCAISPDGFADPPRRSQERGSLPITSQTLKKLTHQWRAEEQAILVGAGTIDTDNPRARCARSQRSQPLPCDPGPQTGRLRPGHSFTHTTLVLWCSAGPKAYPHMWSGSVPLKTGAIEAVMAHLQEAECRSGCWLKVAQKRCRDS